MRIAVDAVAQIQQGIHLHERVLLILAWSEASSPPGQAEIGDACPDGRFRVERLLDERVLAIELRSTVRDGEMDDGLVGEKFRAPRDVLEVRDRVDGILAMGGKWRRLRRHGLDIGL